MEKASLSESPRDTRDRSFFEIEDSTPWDQCSRHVSDAIDYSLHRSLLLIFDFHISKFYRFRILVNILEIVLRRCSWCFGISEILHYSGILYKTLLFWYDCTIICQYLRFLSFLWDLLHLSYLKIIKFYYINFYLTFPSNWSLMLCD